MEKSGFSVGFASGIASAVIVIAVAGVMGGIGSESASGGTAPSPDRYDVLPMLGGIGLGVVDHEQGKIIMYGSGDILDYKKIAEYSFEDMGDVWKPSWVTNESP